MNTTTKLKRVGFLALIVALSYEPHIGCGHSGCCAGPDRSVEYALPIRVVSPADDARVYEVGPRIVAAKNEPPSTPEDEEALAESVAELIWRSQNVKLAGSQIQNIIWMNLRDTSDIRTEFAVKFWTFGESSEERVRIILFSFVKDKSVRCLLNGPGHGVTPVVAQYETPVLFWPSLSGMGQHLAEFAVYSLDATHRTLEPLRGSAMPCQLSGVRIWTDRDGRLCIYSRQGCYRVLPAGGDSFAFVEVEATEYERDAGLGHHVMEILPEDDDSNVPGFVVLFDGKRLTESEATVASHALPAELEKEYNCEQIVMDVGDTLEVRECPIFPVLFMEDGVLQLIPDSFVYALVAVAAGNSSLMVRNDETCCVVPVVARDRHIR